ncbi:vitamin K epoxide reductase family protein [Natronobacterium gregoryi]|uniref:Vitamin K epoxide reductase n=2 Tax=Natronobacterium gregoryi TaxID=44930 RepID=L0AFP5_NATGS|nr:vitamin K epoxide reductase family protein [Natronobacterium gregoryi]AFZ71890.1 vitamin K epoxide reductase family protein [Natronobacterium gregoryi SP2]ELY62489.1 vitamin K epoxide reductase [Natronobacterium gregoryi SP2]PLK20676.1 vitamin K epoxide reductase [Natronobacterium gregoryi SP2]SFJ14712.1 Vitamin K epoxide reductase family protein [Natronobacterium gregoryi]
MSTKTRSIRSFDSEWQYSSSVSFLFGTFAAVAVLGWLVSSLLTAIHVFALPAIPADAPVQGSIEVITSQWAYVFGVPLATLGAFYYLLTLGFTLWWFDTRHPLIVKILTPLTASGVVFSAFFVWLQLVPIGEICPFCMMSAAATVILFGLELAILRRSDAPPLSEMVGDAGTLFDQTNVAVVVIPMLIGLVAIVGMFLIPLLPLPDPVPFA